MENSDEQAIRSLVTTWMDATVRGDLDRVLELMADDVVFLGPGRPPMRGRAAFAEASRAMEGTVRLEGTVDVQDVRVFGDWAYSWVQIALTMHPAGGAPVRREGPALSVLRKGADGRWAIFRDANMVAPVAS
jgi:uncharacterized protein (TIGR02246 family)